MFSTTYATSRFARAQPHRARLHQALTAALLTGGLAALPSSAATITVTSPDDSDTGAIGTCTLRQAIMSMDAGGLVAACSKFGTFGVDDTITFASAAIADAATPGTVTLADSADPNGGIGGTLVIFDAHLTIDARPWRGTGPAQYSGGVTIARPTGATHSFGIIRDTAAAGGSLTLSGLTIRNGDAGNNGGGLYLPSADLLLTDSTVSGNRAGSGGGIYSRSGSVRVERSTVDQNTAYLGGGIHADGMLTLSASTISGNTAMQRGGGIHGGGVLAVTDSTLDGNDALYDGGGIYSSGGTATVAGSTISHNFARYGGGGIHSESGTLTMSNSTIGGNSALRSGAGVLSNGTIELSHVTLSGNTSNVSGGGIDGGGHGTIDHSIIAGNSQTSGSDIHLGGTWTGSDNLTSTTNLDLGPLQDNGGPTRTMLPGAGSTAIDAIPLQACSESVDQRGIARPQGAGCDIGAVEVMPDAIFTDGFDQAHARSADSIVPGFRSGHP